MAVIFAADDGIHGQELWITNGTADGTRLLKDINPSGGGVTGWSTGMIGGKTVFTATDGAQASIWTTDGSEAGTVPIATLGSSDDSVQSFAEAGERLFITVQNADGRELWVTDGTSSGTTYLTPLEWRPLYAPGGISSVGNKFVFANSDAVHGVELWVTDGTQAGTHLLADISDAQYEPYGSWPRELTAFGDKVVFSTDSQGAFITDGTADGTQALVTDPWFFRALFFTPLASDLIFAGRGRASTHYSLWKTDGTPGGTEVVKSFLPDGSYDRWSVSIDQLQARPLGNSVFFSVTEYNYDTNAYGADTGLWLSDGTAQGTVQLTDFDASTWFSVFLRNDLLFGRESLWISDGTTTSTHQISTVSPLLHETTSARLGDKLYFYGTDASTGAELWVTDGTAAGTHLVKDINPTGDSGPGGFVQAGNSLYFAADDGVNGYQLWVTDGTTEGTRLLHVGNGSGTSNPFGLSIVNIAPDDITIAYGWVPENSAAGTFAGNLRAVDFDLTDFDLTETHTYTLLDDAGGRFILEENVVKTANGTTFNFEGVNSYTITVRATDQGGKSVEKQLVIAVADVNEAPVDIILSKSNIAEHTGSGMIVGLLTAADFDVPDAHTFTLMTNAGGRFELHDDKLVVANGALLDYEQKASHTVTVRANDGRGGFIEKTFTISLDDVAAESFTGDPFANVFSGGAGNDSIAGGAGDDKIAGFGGADHLFGGEGADTLHGGESDDRLDGGPGIDRLVGGNGSDFYWITSGDVIIEQAGSGTKDRVLGLNMSFDLGTFAGGFIEQAVVDGLLNVKLTGNAAANALWGNQGANTLNGKLGLDYLVGGIGKDKFVFDTKLSTRNVDRIVDFEKGDRICLDNAIFSKLGAAGALKADFFRPHRADDRNDYIHYDKATGALFYDADGNGTGPGIKFAVVETKPTLTAADFLVI